MIAAIVGAGALGASIASTLAVRNHLREIRLIDEAGAAAAGKALDIQQAGPLHGTSVRLAGASSIEMAADADVVVFADAVGPPQREWEGESGLQLLSRLMGVNPTASFVCAGGRQGWLVERAVVELRLPWFRILGSAPAALHAALRGLVAAEAGVAPHSVAVALAGLPPDQTVVAWEAATVDGVPLTSRLGPNVIAGMNRRLPYLWPPGPMVLGAAAAEAVEGLTRGARRPLPALVVPEASGGTAGRVRMASVLIEPGRIAAADQPALSSHEQVALDNAFAGRPRMDRR
jgi:lactate/malate dehydrogenase, NAD binding domain